MTVTTEKIIFYHIPKTGGMWVKDAMLRAGIKFHVVANKGSRRTKKPFYQEFNLVGGHSCPRITARKHKLGKFSFCFVRHPIAWYRSFWCFRVLSSSQYNTSFPTDSAMDLSYEKYIRNILRIYPGFLTKMYQYYTGKDLKMIDFIGRQENLRSDLIKALDKSGIEYNKKNIKGKRFYNSSYRKLQNNVVIDGLLLRDYCTLTKETKDNLLKAEKWVIDKFYKK